MITNKHNKHYFRLTIHTFIDDEIHTYFKSKQISIMWICTIKGVQFAMFIKTTIFLVLVCISKSYI